MVRNYISILLFLMITLSCYNTLAQVVIGSPAVVKFGSLLQVQNLPDQSGELVNSNKGLLLPRVNLTDVNNLYPMFSSGYDKSKFDLIHTGLLVFNVNGNLLNGDGIGMYVWNGKKWDCLNIVPVL